MSSSPHHLLSSKLLLGSTKRFAVVHNQLQAKDDCWRIDALYKLQPNKVHSKKMQNMKVHHGEVHHKEVHHEEVQLKLQRHKRRDRWEKTTVGILRHSTSCILAAQ